MQTIQEHGADARWTADTLRACTAACFGEGSLIVVANRAPVRYEHGADGRLIARRASGGLVTALQPIVAASRGVWVAHDDDPVARCRAAEAPPGGDDAYRIRPVHLSAQQQRGYYHGFANEGLWPLCHHVHVRPIFRSQDFADYRTANARFADAACEEADASTALILVQDYHLALAPKMIRHRRPLGTIVSFWHVPFPPARQFAICPWARQLVDGLLGSSIAGFQTPEDCRNFIETAEAMLGADISEPGAVSYGGRRTIVRAYPASVEWPEAGEIDAPSIAACRADVQRRYGLPADFQLIVGVDRLDYTKGLEEKLLVFERLLDWRREFRGRLVLLQVASPSRTTLPAYRAMRAKLVRTAERINQRFGAPGYRPIVLVEKALEAPEVNGLLRAADVCYVGSLHDGMNLVAKEFVVARDDHRGVLVLSQFAGAMHELRSALIINPYDVDTSARVLARALRMPPAEQAHAMRQMRAVVAQANGYRWAGEMVTDAAFLRQESYSLGLASSG
ncbi:MAG TPA: trehalose-6-phosphate synthase [Vicinamibacterales bacterium]|nr:trehalose-6-phosphate synthase [Vicinamibacterales bacterium]